MKLSILLIVLVASSQVSSGQVPISLALSNEKHEYPLTSMPVFDQSGEHLFSLLGNTVCVFSTKDGSLIREYILPSHKPMTAGDDGFRESLYAWDQISHAFGGDQLVVVVGGGRQIVLIDVVELISGAKINPTPIRYQLGKQHPPLHFVCTLGDDRMVFVSGDRTRTDRLLLYRLNDYQVDHRSSVELHSAASCTPNYLSTSTIVQPETYLAGPSADGNAVIALRVMPDTKTRYPPSCTAERIEVSWDSHGYGVLKSVSTYRMPTIPVAVSPNLEQLMVMAVKMADKANIQQTIGVSIFDKILSPSPVRTLRAVPNHAVGTPGLWSGDGTRFFVNDGNHSRRPQPRVISVHEPSGHRITALPLGDGISGKVLATSDDGRMVVTSNLLFRKPRPGARTPDKFTNVKFALWKLR